MVKRGLNLFTSNYLEVLAEHLARQIEVPVSSIWRPEVILVQNQGMARWLKLELATLNGICANTLFPFPKVLTQELFKRFVPTLSFPSPYDPEILHWKIFSLLPKFLNNPAFASIHHYLESDLDSRKRYQLAARIAYLFDQYLIFRPEMILEWEKREDLCSWQPLLWRELSNQIVPPHPARVRKIFAEAILKEDVSLDFPERISIFGISALPPFYLEIFSALSRKTQVNLFDLQPCKEYWGDISGDRESKKILKSLGQARSQSGNLHLEIGNSLLASMGKLGRDFLKLIQEAGDWNETSDFRNPIEDNLLHSIQSDILNLREPKAKALLPPGDRSIQIHSCHTPLRELEVLYDHVLDWFNSDSQLRPNDILVMTPDIETYAPLIKAVFESPEAAYLRIPFGLADRGARNQSPVVDMFLKLLQLPGSRMGSATVLSFLEAPTIRSKFNLEEGDLFMIRKWVEDTRICWGMDSEHRAQFDLPDIEETTWQLGLQRLFVGYAMAGEQRHLFQGILPYDDIEGENSDILGDFAEFIGQLFLAARSLQISRTMKEWKTVLLELLTTFFEHEEETETDLLIIRQAIEQMALHLTIGGVDEPVNHKIILEHLSRALNEDRFRTGFLTGGVTFCALKPMRSIPFKIICLLGMSDTSFPRSEGSLSFDLMVQKPKLGDRSARDDDRYLFLETLISARNTLYISYIGQSNRDNRKAPPSVLVSELLEYIDHHYQMEQTPSLREFLVVEHRLQPFSALYFNNKDSRYFSFSNENCRAIQAASLPRRRAGPLMPSPVPPPPEAERRSLEIPRLAEFFCHPAKYFLNHQLNLRLPAKEEILEEREVFVCENLEGYLFKQESLLRKFESSVSPITVEAFQATGQFPLGEVGRCSYSHLLNEAEKIWNRAKPYWNGQFLPPVEMDLKVGDVRLFGTVSQLTNTGLLYCRCAKIKAKDLLRAWIWHLTWNLHSSGHLSSTTLIGEDKAFRFRSVANPEIILQKLLRLYTSGLSYPLVFFPECSLALAIEEGRERKKADPMAVVIKKWEGDQFSQGEGNDPYFTLCFGKAGLFDDSFKELARAVFGDLNLHLESMEE